MHFGTAAWPRDKLKMSIKTPASSSPHAPSTSLEISSGFAALACTECIGREWPFQTVQRVLGPPDAGPGEIIIGPE